VNLFSKIFRSLRLYKLTGALFINQIPVLLKLGVPDIERHTPQLIYIDISIRYKFLPQCCYTDNINDTLCYDQLATEINSFCVQKEFHLIEHLAFSLHEFLSTKISNAHIGLRIHKKPISNPLLSNGVIFELNI
jgi:dihydroneopterin aldolase